ncbi:hypothetical protein U876_18795 [Aeromonas hydrophila NJ-35]|nr:hypothetical protein V428_05175 [Aeromonas hydrophila subsp. hydrophila AL09-71]AHX68289.1 hypothetical protein V429_05180 [Aeromonas hydrophila pc104A]AJE38663.1 hypothetical protein V469_18175 [Aeromonas hydrophila J-1]AKJ37095.1 hypothetical protein U876_18795 [Aeromonas hydrophila NJ-35]ALQ64764.1 hypothetical protein AS145_18345 [Aeromonas hydrophila]
MAIIMGEKKKYPIGLDCLAPCQYGLHFTRTQISQSLKQIRSMLKANMFTYRVYYLICGEFGAAGSEFFALYSDQCEIFFALRCQFRCADKQPG